MHNSLDGEVATQHAHEFKRQVCVSASPDTPGHSYATSHRSSLQMAVTMVMRKKWTGRWSWHSWISSLLSNALQDQGVIPVPIHTVVGPHTGKSGGKCPFSVLHTQWEDALTASERPRAQQCMGMDSWQKGLAYLSSELPGRELSPSKLAWGGQPPKATSCP